MNIASNNVEITSGELNLISKDNRTLVFQLTDQPVNFHKINLKDKNNGISYDIRICTLQISSEYMMPLMQSNFRIHATKSLKSCKIELFGFSRFVIFNDHGQNPVKENLELGGHYQCNYNTELLLSIDEEELVDYGKSVNISVDFGGVEVPFGIILDDKEMVILTGRRALQDKLESNRSFQFINEQVVRLGTQDYSLRGDFKIELLLESKIVDENIISGNISEFKQVPAEIESSDLKISKELETAYYQYLDVLKSHRTLPSLAYLGDEEIHEAAEKYVQAFKDEFSSLKEKDTLTEEQQNALKIGVFSVGQDHEEYVFAPTHPLNVAYQLTLLNEKGMDEANEQIIDRLNSVYLLPYIRMGKKTYKVSDHLNSKEWKRYVYAETKRFMGNRKYVADLVEDKIKEYTSHFKYIFDDIGNKTIKINLINMGDCSEVLQGIAKFYVNCIKKDPNVDHLYEIEVNIYTREPEENTFNILQDRDALRDFLGNNNLGFDSGTAMNDLEGILSKNVNCFFNKSDEDFRDYKYAHISFYEMESEIMSETATMNQIATGVSLNGIISGVPSSKYGMKYRTGFGSKYANSNQLEDFIELYNSLYNVSDSGNPYQSGASISTQIADFAVDKMDDIYNSSSWVVFVDPKVDLDFFSEKEANSDLLIIHYSDQYTTSSGYDAITVTRKSKQYEKIIREFLIEKGLNPSAADVKSIINLFNAINGDWLLRLVSSKQIVGKSKESLFTREKISIVAAIKVILAKLKSTHMIWVPISIEELLRVSGGVGLSRKEGLLSADNLGFSKGPTSDDLLFVGIKEEGSQLKVYFYPTEVKTGLNSSAVLSKAHDQVLNTVQGFANALNPKDQDITKIKYKFNRNFMMQLVINSCEKMKIYKVDETQDWNIVLDQYRQRLLNEEYQLFVNEPIADEGKAAILSFKTALMSSNTSIDDDNVQTIEIPENEEYKTILSNVSKVQNEFFKDDGLPSTNNLINTSSNVDSHDNTSDTSEIVNHSNNANSDDDLLNVNDIVSDFIHTDSHEDHKDEKETINDQLDQLLDSLNEVLPDETKENFNVEDKVENQDGVKVQNLENDENAKVDDSDVHEEPSKEDENNHEEGIEIEFGNNLNNGNKVIWKPNDTEYIFHTNTGIIGTMGTGKTQFTKSLITQLHRQQKYNVNGSNIGILIFDYKGDYNETKESFVNATDAKVLKPFHLPFNPFALIKPKKEIPLLPVHVANSFTETIQKIYGLGPKQTQALLQCINSAYAQAGINKVNQATWDRPAPTFNDVYEIYMDNDEIKKNDSLYAAMAKIQSFEIFEANSKNTKSLYDVLDGVVTIDLSGYDNDIQNLIIAITLNLFYNQMQNQGSSQLNGKYREITKFILVDEADNFMSNDFPALKKIMKEGREFGVGTILSTQSLSHFGNGEDDYSRYVLTWVVHKVTDLKGSDIDYVFGVESKSTSERQLANRISSLDKHTSMVKIGNQQPIYMEDLPFWKLVDNS